MNNDNDDVNNDNDNMNNHNNNDNYNTNNDNNDNMNNNLDNDKMITRLVTIKNDKDKCTDNKTIKTKQ